MSAILTVNLSDQSPSECWGNNPLVTFDQDSANIHIGAVNSPLDIQKAARTIQAMGVSRAHLSGSQWNDQYINSFARGFYTADDNQTLTWDNDNEQVHNQINVRRWVRNIVNGTPADVYPETLANDAIEFIRSFGGDKVSAQVIKGDDLIEHQWHGIHHVGRASVNPPLMAIIDYNPSGKDDAPVHACLVGKGITFDSGGYSIKDSQGMLTMKCDMGGAAVVTGALASAISQGLDKRVKVILCCAENLISGNAYKLGDVITYKNGTTVEVVNTDAEGRLVLADGLMAATEMNPTYIVDAATLTGAAMVAVGSEYNALFTMDEALRSKAMDSAQHTVEPAWSLPLEKFHRDNCPSAYADTANSRPQKGGGPGGASNAAGFLSRFVNEDGKGWLHMDLASAFHNSGNAHWATGATGLGFETIAKMILD